MAANSTPLAIQCASGVAAPPRYGLQLRRNLVTKTHKTTIMAAAANPLQYEAGVLVFPPCELHRNAAAITKRNKALIVAAYPTKIQVLTPGIPDYTEGKIENKSGGTISLDDKAIWEGAQTGDFPRAINDQDVGKFKHIADSGGKIIGSVGALEYKLEGGRKWIIAWSNPQNEVNKVYTEILEETADWEQIKRDLQTKGKQIYPTTGFGYSSEIEIDRTSGTPNLKAILLKPSPPNENKEK